MDRTRRHSQPLLFLQKITLSLHEMVTDVPHYVWLSVGCVAGVCPGLLRGAGVLGAQRPPPGALLPAHLLPRPLAPTKLRHSGDTTTSAHFMFSSHLNVSLFWFLHNSLCVKAVAFLIPCCQLYYQSQDLYFLRRYSHSKHLAYSLLTGFLIWNIFNKMYLKKKGPSQAQ